ncbi:DUF1178 family protein [Erythrobacteraceae bacterium CFH 75059]|uniref:DUF1178 family protein n=1 Tax=Qipengyuania thermophila TaxID=2509361 RepID=UPI00101FE091|nr:DUF1178 family protein [Qipengyuania thermophila]TCD05266.1 DUF1178 family protein [Erythrobacteraceae bacterium CFH 75059]
MIVYALHCERAHPFDGWFASAASFDTQQQEGLLVCPVCNSRNIAKAPMAPAVRTRSSQPSHAEARPASAEGGRRRREATEVRAAAEAWQRLVAAQQALLAQSRWVGTAFSETARQMHYGETEAEPIHGTASLDDARALHEEGIAVLPLPCPVAPPDELQ